MRRTTAIRHLVELAEAAGEMARWKAAGSRNPLDALWVTGDLLTPADEFEFGAVVVQFDVPPEELPWLSIHPAEPYISGELRLGKRPISWCTRPSAWPAWTYRHRRAARFWTAGTGIDESVIEALREHRLPPVVEPTDDELVTQCRVELDLARTHLRGVLERFWDYPQPRRKSREDREDELWRAATAVLELGEAAEGKPWRPI